MTHYCIPYRSPIEYSGDHVTTEQDKFTHFRQIADSIVTMFGSNCEVAVHDLSDLNHSLIHLAGNITDRKRGAPATDLLIREITKNGEECADILNYSTTTTSGRSLKSSTIFLKNDDGEIYGAFCINFDTTELFNASQLLANLIKVEETGGQKTSETFVQSASQTIDEIFKQTICEIGKQPVSMTTQERIDMVARLKEKGVFQMKGAVRQIAAHSGVTKFTIYNHLKEIQNTTSINQRKES